MNYHWRINNGWQNYDLEAIMGIDESDVEGENIELARKVTEEDHSLSHPRVSSGGGFDMKNGVQMIPLVTREWDLCAFEDPNYFRNECLYVEWTILSFVRGMITVLFLFDSIIEVDGFDKLVRDSWNVAPVNKKNAIQLHGLYKIIAKILANRLVGVLGDLVNEVQSAFVADRQILDGPFILDEDSFTYLGTNIWGKYVKEAKLGERIVVGQDLDNHFEEKKKARSGIEEMQLNSLAEISRMTTLVPCEDRYVWTLESDGVFSVASIRKEIDGNRFQVVFCLVCRLGGVKSMPIKGELS
ncbi:hypothetical protein Tco_0005026 [Tanacetum coccineum]